MLFTTECYHVCFIVDTLRLRERHLRKVIEALYISYHQWYALKYDVHSIHFFEVGCVAKVILLKCVYKDFILVGWIPGLGIDITFLGERFFDFKKWEMTQWIVLILKISNFCPISWEFDYEIFQKCLIMRGLILVGNFKSCYTETYIPPSLSPISVTNIDVIRM